MAGMTTRSPFSLLPSAITRPPRHQQLAWLGLGIALLGAVFLSQPWQWLDTAEQLTVDLRFNLRGATRAEPAAVIVGVADSSFTIAERAPAEAAREPVLAAMAAPWPWDRSIFAGTVRRLRAGGARLIVFDIVLAAETAGDAEFARALAEPGAPVVLASWWQEAHTAIGEGTVTLVEPRASFLAAPGVRTGYANVWPDDDGVLRHLTTELSPADLLGRSAPAAGPGLPSLAYAGALSVRTQFPARPGYINYRGPAGSIPALPVEDLFLPDRWNGRWLQSGELFRNRIVWVGPLSEIRFKDYHATPFGRMSGVEAQAQALETLLGDGPLQPLGRRGELLCLWALALGGMLTTFLFRHLAGQLAVVAAAAAGWSGLAFGLFAAAGVVLPVVAPLAAGFIAASSGLGVRFIAEQRERRRMRRVLARYVSEEVAQIIVNQPEEFSHALRGERRAVTVLFADLRGFTTWMETAPPEALVAQLNEYFRAVVDCVLAQGGTLQKFIGDAVLAVWGDTRTAGPAADAARAVEAALAMHAAVARLNASWTGRPDRTPLRIGIGLHHGGAMVGNLGHPQRMEFTVLGDAVNVAARLESANRQLGTDILVSDTIRELLATTHRFAPLGRTILKGKREAVGLFAPLGPLSLPAPDWLGRAEAAEAAWRTGDFAAAAAGYAALAAAPTALTEFFHTRRELAHRFAASPPAGWKGELPLDTK
jgi:adenylate cyclase